MAKETKEQLLEALYSSGVRKRPSLTTKIETCEDTCAEAIKASVEEFVEQKSYAAEGYKDSLADLRGQHEDRVDKAIAACEKETGRSYAKNNSIFRQFEDTKITVRRFKPFAATVTSGGPFE